MSALISYMLNSVEISIFQQVPFENIGWLQKSLDKSGLRINLQSPKQQVSTIKNISQQAGIILMGGPMSANDNLPFLHAQLDVLALALRLEIPILGICLGAQLLAKAAGSSVYRNYSSEIGFFDTTLTQAAFQDPVLAKLNNCEIFFHWHSDTFDLPSEATRLAFSKRTQNQAFRIGKTAYGLQFHPEVTPAMISDWGLQKDNCSDVADIDLPFDPNTNAGRLEEVAALIFDSWIKLALNKQTQCE